MQDIDLALEGTCPSQQSPESLMAKAEEITEQKGDFHFTNCR